MPACVSPASGHWLWALSRRGAGCPGSAGAPPGGQDWALGECVGDGDSVCRKAGAWTVLQTPPPRTSVSHSAAPLSGAKVTVGVCGEPRRGDSPRVPDGGGARIGCPRGHSDPTRACLNSGPSRTSRQLASGPAVGGDSEGQGRAPSPRLTGAAPRTSSVLSPQAWPRLPTQSLDTTPPSSQAPAPSPPLAKHLEEPGLLGCHWPRDAWGTSRRALRSRAVGHSRAAGGPAGRRWPQESETAGPPPHSPGLASGIEGRPREPSRVRFRAGRPGGTLAASACGRAGCPAGAGGGRVGGGGCPPHLV